MKLTRHQTRNTALMAVRFPGGAQGVAQPETAVRTAAPAAKSLLPCSLLFAIVHHCSVFFWGLECTEPVFKHCLRYWAGLTTKAVGLYFSPHAEAKCMRGLAGRGASRLPRATRPLRFFTNHESRKMAFMAVRFASPADKSWIPHEAFARHGAAWRGNLVAQSLLAFPEFPRISHYFPFKNCLIPCPRTVSRSGSASRRTPLACISHHMARRSA